MAEMMTGWTAIVLIVFYMILALVIYHKVFVVFYFDLFHGFMKELLVAFFLAALMTGLTLMKWKIAAVIILIVALAIILKCEDNGKRILIGILAAIVIGFIIYSGLNFSKEVNNNIKESTEEELPARSNEYGDGRRKQSEKTSNPIQEENDEEIDFSDNKDQYEQPDQERDNLIPEMEDEESEEILSEYILPDSSTKLLKAKDVKDLSRTQCRLAKNEIYARHGRRFQDQELQGYFDSLSWYYGTIEPEDFDESVFNKIEKANIKLLAKYEKK